MIQTAGKHSELRLMLGRLRRWDRLTSAKACLRKYGHRAADMWWISDKPHQNENGTRPRKCQKETRRVRRRLKMSLMNDDF